MISKICSPIYNVKSYSNNSTPSFGLAKLNDRARNGADSFGYENNNYLSSDLLKKQGVLSKSALTKPNKSSLLCNIVDNNTFCLSSNSPNEPSKKNLSV